MKKAARTAHHARHQKKKNPLKKSKPLHTVSFRILFVGLSVLLLILGVKNFQTHVYVLGTTTGPVLLAEDGNDAGGQKGVDQGDGPNVQQSKQQENSQQNQPAQGSNPQEQQVDCVNPENGQHFTTSFHNCQEVNQKKGSDGFRFTPLTSPGMSIKPQEIEQPEVEATPPAHDKLELQTEGNKGEINMETPGLHVEVKREDDGSLHITAHKADGTEVNLQTNALDRLNEALKDKGVTVGTASGSARNLVLRRGSVEAETELPISVDPSTHELTVTTPNGVKAVTVLPDQAVSSLLNNKIFTSVETQASASGATKQISSLTELNNQPVFAVNGISQKNLLGIFPLGFAKTAFVSANNGNVVQVNETILNRILEALSF